MKWLVFGRATSIAVLVAGAIYFKNNTEHIMDQGYSGVPVQMSIIMMSLLIVWAVFMVGILWTDLTSAYEKRNHVKY